MRLRSWPAPLHQCTLFAQPAACSCLPLAFIAGEPARGRGIRLGGRGRGSWQSVCCSWGCRQQVWPAAVTAAATSAAGSNSDSDSGSGSGSSSGCLRAAGSSNYLVFICSSSGGGAWRTIQHTRLLGVLVGECDMCRGRSCMEVGLSHAPPGGRRERGSALCHLGCVVLQLWAALATAHRRRRQWRMQCAWPSLT